MGPRCAHIVIQPNNGTTGSVWLANTPREGGTHGYSSLASHVGIAVGQLLTQFGIG